MSSEQAITAWKTCGNGAWNSLIWSFSHLDAAIILSTVMQTPPSRWLEMER